MLLAIDIGNTSTTVGVFDGEKLIVSWRIASDIKRSEDEYGIVLKNLIKDSDLLSCVTEGIISSVVIQLTEKFQLALEKYLGIKAINVSHKINTGIEVLTDNPSEVGADRICNACAAAKLYKAPVIVVDFGTATSFDIVNSKKQFIGGVITAGMKIQAAALSEFTSKLPKLKIEAPKEAIGRNTIDAMLSGIVRGHAAMIDGLLEECQKELDEKAVIVATGGYSPIISKYMKREFDYINRDLTLIGLKLIYDLNTRKPSETKGLELQY
ncbi:type III pantothenate kinase [bacterium]|nr:type III pantothenate kinase [bacterium]